MDSHTLADMVTGEWDLDDLDHAARVQKLYAVIKLYDTMLDVGDMEHTGDWDWRITVVHGQSKIAGTDDTNDRWSDTIKLNYTVEPDDYTTGFERWSHLSVFEFPSYSSELDAEVLIPIDQISSVTITQA